MEGAGVPLGDIQAFLAIYDAISELKSKNAETSERVEAVMELSGGAMEATSGLGDRGSKITKPAAGGKALASENAGGLAGGLSGATDFFGVIKGSRASSLAPGRSWTS